MSVARVLRFLAGFIIAAILLAIILPVVGIPSSRFLPPAHVWDKAQGYARGVVTDKFYSETGNPFDVGGHILFVDYAFYAKTPGASPTAKGASPSQTVTGKVRVAQPDYDAVLVPKNNTQADKAKGDEKVAVVPGQYVRVKYELTNPEINGTTALYENGTWVPWGGRSVAGSANILSGWLLWIVLALGLGYGIMLILERFSGRENI